LSGRQLIPWRTFDPDGRFAGLVFAHSALDATRQLPARHSLYVGDPSPDKPDRPWWIEAWQTGAVDPDDLLANDQRPADE
jgi:hypothetical protein